MEEKGRLRLMRCKRRTSSEGGSIGRKSVQSTDGQTGYLQASSPDPWSTKRKESLILSQVNSSGSTCSVSLSFLHSTGQLLYQVRFREAKFGAKNGELEKGVPASQCLGRRWLLVAGSSCTTR